MSSRTKEIGQLFFVDLIGSVVWFPIWWYTRGLQGVVGASINTIQYRVRSYALDIWIKNFFVPMYGSSDWTGRLISLIMRFVVLVFRLVSLVVEAVIYAAGVLLWCAAPLVFLFLFVLSLAQGTFLEQIRTVGR